jgi:hypothetical protein
MQDRFQSLRVPGLDDVPVEISVRLVVSQADDKRQYVAKWSPGRETPVELPEGLGQARVELPVRAEANGAFSLRLRVEAGLRDGWYLREAALVLALPNFDWTAVLPSGWGREVSNVPRGFSFEGNYPGWSCLAQLIILQGTAGGLSLRARDAGLELKKFRLRCDEDRVTVEIARVAEKRGEAWVVGGDCDIVIAPYSGGWDAAAQEYRREQERIRPELSRAHPLHPLLACDPFWLTQDCFCYPPHSVDDTLRAARELDGPVLCHWYNWQDAPFDTRYPEAIPSCPGVAEGMERLRAANIAAIPYLNSRLWDTTIASWHEAGEAAAIRTAAGEPILETYPTSNIPLAVACPSQLEYRRRVVNACRSVVDRHALPGAYLDQLGAAFGMPCYVRGHQHPPGGAQSWTAGQRTLVAEARAALEAVCGGPVILTTENAAEPLVDLLDGFLYYCGRPYECIGRPVPLWQTIYGDFGTSFAENFGEAARHECVASPAEMLQKIARQAIFGASLGWLSPRFVLDGCAAVGTLMRNARAARARIWQVMRAGSLLPEFLDSTGERTGVFMAAWRSGSAFVALAANPSHEPREFTWPDGSRGHLPPLGAQAWAPVPHVP